MMPHVDGLALEDHKAAGKLVGRRNRLNALHPGRSSIGTVWPMDRSGHAAAGALVDEEQPLHSTITRDPGIRIVRHKNHGSNRTVTRAMTAPPPRTPALPPSDGIEGRPMLSKDGDQFISEPGYRRAEAIWLEAPTMDGIPAVAVLDPCSTMMKSVDRSYPVQNPCGVFLLARREGV